MIITYSIFLFCVVLTKISFSNACSMDGVTNWLLPVTESIYDTDRGVFFRRTTFNIAGINSVTYSEGLNAGPYITVSYNDSSEFTISTNDEFPNYEERETVDSMGVTVSFRCTGGSVSTLVFFINIIDTNNNAPQFRPNDNYHFKIAPPVPPGFLITDCINDIIARDIDLTTVMIVFEMEENPYFEITYNGSTTPKEFKAMLRTTTFIRRLSEPVTLWISATDVDRTNDPPLTTNGTILIEADTEFEFPDDVIFSESFYLATYSNDHIISLQKEISLQQGYDANVNFSLEGDNKEHFDIVIIGNSIELKVASQLPVEILSQAQIYLVIRASREHTSGATATIIVNLQARILAFQSLTYSGYLINSNVKLEAIELSAGYDDDIIFSLIGDYTSYFSISNNENEITLKVSDDLPKNIVSENNILIFNLLANGSNSNTATTTIILEIIKEDGVTPIFSKNLYNGAYSLVSEVNIENISLIQGFDANVTFHLTGDHAHLFDISSQGNNISVFLQSTVPREIIYDEKVLILNIIAEKPFTVGANAAVSISFPPELTNPEAITFSKKTYIGQIENNVLSIEKLEVIGGFHTNTEFLLTGEFEEFFVIIEESNTVTIQQVKEVSSEILQNNAFITLEIGASHSRAIRGHATVILEILKDSQPTAVFEQPYYFGEYSNENGLQFVHTIQLNKNFNEPIIFKLEGDNSELITLIQTDNSVSLTIIGPLPPEILLNNRQLIFIISAEMYNNVTIARSAIIISLIDDQNNKPVLSFEKTNYVGTINNSTIDLESISLIDDFSEDVLYSLRGELASFFTTAANGRTVSIVLPNAIPEESLPANQIIILELQAAFLNASSTNTFIVLRVLEQDNVVDNTNLVQFAETYYIGYYNEVEGLEFSEYITLINGNVNDDDNIEFTLCGENSIWFKVISSDEGLTIALNDSLPWAVSANNTLLIFEINAITPNSPLIAKATIIIIISKDNQLTLVEFEKRSYLGSVDNSSVNLEPIRLIKGFSINVTFSLIGEFSTFFTQTTEGEFVIISVQNDIPEEILSQNQVILLELKASTPESISNYTIVVLEIVKQNEPPADFELLMFNQTYYTGLYSDTNGLVFNSIISLQNGYDENVDFTLDGEHSIWFSLEPTENGLLLILSSPIPLQIVHENWHLIFTVTAHKPESISARSTIVISLPNDSDDSNVFFDKFHYSGTWDNDNISHENIFVSGYTGTVIEINGDFSNFFTAQINAGVVTVQLRGPTTLPTDTSHLVLELRVPGAGSVLILYVIEPDSPTLPTIIFSSESYVMQVDESQTGIIGQVKATSSNGEDIVYSLLIDQAELEERLSINNDGELSLSAQTGSGVYTFRVSATTVLTQVNNSAVVLLIVDESDTCSSEIGVPPLIILDRDEESPHMNLVTLNRTTHENCQYVMINHWPADQTWLYVDENGLHARSIDREHETIAFMALSQIQVELTLNCESELTARIKSSLPADVTSNPLGPYDYGSSKWVLTNTISHNARRSFVNLIVNDINDNDPLFTLKQHEPIAVGYPLPELVEAVSPQALVQLEATDADIGENAALVYWSDESVLAVSASTGFVHVRKNADLENGARLTIHATDRNGAGRTGSIDILIRSLNINRIAVVTISGAFLEDEKVVLANLSNALGYEIKSLRSVVIPVDSDSNETKTIYRKTREIDSDNGALLQLYIYGLIDREPVEVTRLTTDIENNVIVTNIAATLSLQDHLENRDTGVTTERDTALLAAIIALSILLFILIVALVAWLFLKWRKKRNYDEFSDESSLASRDQIQRLPKDNENNEPRLDLEELKRSEKRLQEILDAPVDKPAVDEPKQKEVPTETIVNVPSEPRMPLIIQSIDKLKDASETSDDEDEFGESKQPRRKSVVTFNENVEKIIHLEDDQSEADYEIYKF